jgi:hypothetical protein
MKWFSSLFPLLLWASGAGAIDILEHEVNPPWIDNPNPARFSVCFNHSCKETINIGITPIEWQKIQALFEPAPKSAQEERVRLAKAVALMEKLVGPKANTANDKAYNFRGMMAEGNQQDCIDESTNSTTYLTMMEQDGLLRFHKVLDKSTRGWFIMGHPHTTAVIRDNNSGIEYAVDSWFHDNGEDAEVVPLDLWFKGWDPEKDPRP